MDTNQSIENWGQSSEFLLIKDVNNEDIIIVDELVGVVDSYGKSKFQLKVNHNGKSKLLNINKFQFRQMQPIRAGDRFAVVKVSLNGGTALNYRRL